MATTTERAFNVEPERELISLLRSEGASEAFITLIKIDSEEAGANRNSCRQEINKWIRWNDGEITEAAIKRPGFGGGFFEKMWNGDIYGAYCHADMNNQRLLIEAFGLSYINSQKPAGYPEVSA